MKKTLLLPLMATALLSSSFAVSAEKCLFPAVRKLDRGSEISTFVYDFWDYTKKNLSKDFKKFPFVLQADGPSVGDYHFGNVGVYFNDKKSDKKKGVDLAIIDMDDSGSGNQFADLIKLLLFVKSEYKQDSLSKLALQFYLQGLENKDGSLLPQFNEDDKIEKGLKKSLKDLADLLKKDKDYFDQANQNYVLGKIEMKKGEIKFAKSFGLTPMSQLDSDRASEESKGRFAVAKLGKILDSGFQINLSGSSIGAYRFVYLVATSETIKNKETGQIEPFYLIVELKQNNCAGVVKYEPNQSNPSERFASNKVNLQSAEFWKQAKVIDMGERTYLLRIKQAGPMEKVIEKVKKKDDVEAFTAFYAYTLGRIQSPTANGAFVTGLAQNVKEKDFIKALEDFVEAYDKSLSSRTKK